MAHAKDFDSYSTVSAWKLSMLVSYICATSGIRISGMIFARNNFIIFHSAIFVTETPQFTSHTGAVKIFMLIPIPLI